MGWISGFSTFAVAVVIAWHVASTSHAEGNSGNIAYFVYPYAAAVVWIPLGIVSFVPSLIAIARRERTRAAAFTLAAINVVGLVGVRAANDFKSNAIVAA